MYVASISIRACRPGCGGQVDLPDHERWVQPPTLFMLPAGHFGGGGAPETGHCCRTRTNVKSVHSIEGRDAGTRCGAGSLRSTDSVRPQGEDQREPDEDVDPGPHQHALNGGTRFPEQCANQSVAGEAGYPDSGKMPGTAPVHPRRAGSGLMAMALGSINSIGIPGLQRPPSLRASGKPDGYVRTTQS